MEREQLEATVKEILVEHLGVSLDELTDDTLLVPEHDNLGRVTGDKPSLGADSLDVVELVMAFECQFRIEISDEEAETLNAVTVKGLVDYLDGRLSPEAKAA